MEEQSNPTIDSLEERFPTETIETIRGQVEAVGPEGIKIARRWWALDPTAEIALPEVGQLVVAEVAGGLVSKVTCIASPEPEGCPPTA